MGSSGLDAGCKISTAYEYNAARKINAVHNKRLLKRLLKISFNYPSCLVMNITKKSSEAFIV
jgi:hypothetical protein